MTQFTAPNGKVFDIVHRYAEILRPGDLIIINKGGTPRIVVQVERVNHKRGGTGTFKLKGRPIWVHYGVGQRYPALKSA